MRCCFVFYDSLNGLCERRGVSPSKVLDALGISRGSLGRWKSGGRPRNEILQRLYTLAIKQKIPPPAFNRWGVALHIIPRPVCPGNVGIRSVALHDTTAVRLIGKGRVTLIGGHILAADGLDDADVLRDGLV